MLTVPKLMIFFGGSDMKLNYTERTASGVECVFYSFGSTGLKVYHNKPNAVSARNTQKYLSDLGLAPKVFSEVFEVDYHLEPKGRWCPMCVVGQNWVENAGCLNQEETTTKYAYITEVVEVASKMLQKYLKEGQHPSYQGSPHYDEVVTLFAETKHKFRESLRELLGTDAAADMDLHESNWGLTKDSKPVVIDTGYYFYNSIDEAEIQQKVGLVLN